MSANATPAARGYSMPAEWEEHESCYLAWPIGDELWEGRLGAARAQWVALCNAIGSGESPSEALEILVPDAEQEQLARRALPKARARFHRMRYGDIWLRDTGPVFLRHGSGERICARFAFNGWGGKYVYPGDESVAGEIADQTGLSRSDISLVFEGGAVDVDGRGTCLASEGCLLDPKRNPGVDRSRMEALLGDALGVRRVLWLDGALRNDHTDGHVDTLARFAAPGVVVCMKPVSTDDPNAEILEQTAERLRGLTDAAGKPLRLVSIPSPGRVVGAGGAVMPASYLNFYIGNRVVAVPAFGSASDDEAVTAIAELFPDRRAIGLPANAILEGGGAFHCVTLPLPSGGAA